MEPSELITIRTSADPIGEIITRLENKNLQASEAVMTGLLGAKQIHHFVLFCMYQVITTVRQFHASFETEELGEVLYQKLCWCQGRGNSTELKESAEKLFLFAMNTPAVEDHEDTDDLMHQLAWALDEDPYAAHGWVGFSPPYYGYRPEAQWEKFPPIPEEARRQMMKEWRKQRRQFMLNLLKNEVKTYRDLYTAIGGLVLKTVPPAFSEIPLDEQPVIVSPITKAPPTTRTTTKQPNNIQRLEAKRKKTSNW